MESAKQLAETAAARGNFDFLETVSNRAFPEIQVPLFVDEVLLAKLQDLNEERQSIDAKIARSKTKATTATSRELVAALEQITQDREEVIQQLRAGQYTALIRGINTDTRDALRAQAELQFPLEYQESTSPITGAVTRTELPSEQRDIYFATLVRHAHLVSITAPDGSVDADFTPDKVAAIWKRLPVTVQLHLDDAINKTAVATNYYMELVSEVF